MYWNFGGLLRGPRDARFSRADGGLVVEIGFGNGEYLAHLAGANPDSTAVGIEVSQWCIAKAARRALAMGRLNVRLLHGDARYLLRAAFEPECVRAIYMNFPCPWPKKRHAGRRVATPDFARLISSRLFPGGTFTLATDVGWYAEETREIFAGCAGFEAETAEGVAGLGCGTKYERKWSSMGRDTHMVVAK
ncbi:MAG: tRNA (guanosine(46)-N7)-methyltransferase TrmB, partial [Synergistaceae bacterium]|nr:tRNA (guanosine(46)-N7)-methyltransferase TrmB [Synergistaceae bacterium]